MIVSVMIFNC